MKNIVPAVIVIAMILGGLINGALDGDKFLGRVFWAVAGLAMLVILVRGYLTGSAIDRLDSSSGRHTVRAHILLHIVPLTYFPVAYALDTDKVLAALYLIPVMIFFVSGVRTWRLCHETFGNRLYKMFQIGNRQMLLLFPVAIAVDMAGWPVEGAGLFSRLMHVYFIIHFMLTGITVPLMDRDLRRYTDNPSVSGSDARA